MRVSPEPRFVRVLCRCGHGTVSELNAGIVLLRRSPLNELTCLSLCMDIISGNINMSGDAFLRQKLYSYRNCGLKTSERAFKRILHLHFNLKAIKKILKSQGEKTKPNISTLPLCSQMMLRHSVFQLPLFLFSSQCTM